MKTLNIYERLLIEVGLSLSFVQTIRSHETRMPWKLVPGLHLQVPPGQIKRSAWAANTVAKAMYGEEEDDIVLDGDLGYTSVTAHFMENYSHFYTFHCGLSVESLESFVNYIEKNNLDPIGENPLDYTVTQKMQLSFYSIFHRAMSQNRTAPDLPMVAASNREFRPTI
jgi:hypothetical protein